MWKSSINSANNGVTFVTSLIVFFLTTKYEIASKQRCAYPFHTLATWLQIKPHPFSLLHTRFYHAMSKHDNRPVRNSVGHPHSVTALSCTNQQYYHPLLHKQKSKLWNKECHVSKQRPDHEWSPTQHHNVKSCVSLFFISLSSFNVQASTNNEVIWAHTSAVSACQLN